MIKCDLITVLINNCAVVKGFLFNCYMVAQITNPKYA